MIVISKNIFGEYIKIYSRTLRQRYTHEALRRATYPHFGHENPITAGYSMVQLIETSSVTGHFSEFKKSCYINIFSCVWYDMEKTAQFCQDFFEAKRIDSTFLKRP